MSKLKFKGLNNNQLKIIACISMLIDHAGLALFPDIELFRIIGRIALPIFAYMIAEGCAHTRNRKKYLGTILTMGIVFQLVYYFFLDDIYQGILITFSLSIITIFALDGIFGKAAVRYKLTMLLPLAAVVVFGIVFPELYGDKGFAIDYGLWGLLLPVIIYFAPGKIWKIIVTAVLLISMSLFDDPLQWWALLTIPLFILYNGKRGKAKMKYFFYIFYPLHLVLIYAISFLMYMID